MLSGCFSKLNIDEENTLWIYKVVSHTFSIVVNQAQQKKETICKIGKINFFENSQILQTTPLKMCLLSSYTQKCENKLSQHIKVVSYHFDDCMTSGTR